MQKEIQLGEGDLKSQLDKLSEQEVAQILQQSNQWTSYVQQQNMMIGIYREMKEIAELPSEKIKNRDSSAISKVEFPDAGGVLTWMENYDYPYKGYPYFEFVDKIDAIKKTARSFLSGIYHQVKGKNKLLFLTLIPAVWASKSLLRAGVYTNFRTIERFRVKEERYCTAIRELHRAFSDPQDEFRNQLRDLVCMILEFDNAYRFRAQDVLVEMDKLEMRTNPIGETLRLFDLMQSREHQQEVSDTWKLAKYAVKFYLRFDKQLTSVIQDTLLKLNLNKFGLAIEDKAYCVTRSDYTFGFTQHPSAEDEKLIFLSNIKKVRNEAMNRIEKESTQAHEKVLKREHKQEELIELDKKYGAMMEEEQKKYELEKANYKPL